MAILRLATGGFALLALLVTVHANQALAKAPMLWLPLECMAQKTCFIQNYVDTDPSKGVRDYTCAKSSYEGHKGVDFRLRSLADMKKGVRVLAAAAGIVKATRDGMEDRIFSKSRAAKIKSRECGNGLVIDHGDGWETQYCHMRKGSVKVKQGQRVTKGQALGLVGLSGKTVFPHIHLSVRHKGKIIDPFTGATPVGGACQINKGAPLFETGLVDDFPYKSGQPFLMGFADKALTKAELLAKGATTGRVSVKSRALVFYGMALNLLKGDQLRIRILGPREIVAATVTKPMNRHKASYYAFVGKKRTGFAWPAGNYQGSFALLRKGQVVWEKQILIDLK